MQLRCLIVVSSVVALVPRGSIFLRSNCTRGEHHRLDPPLPAQRRDGHRGTGHMDANNSSSDPRAVQLSERAKSMISPSDQPPTRHAEGLDRGGIGTKCFRFP